MSSLLTLRHFDLWPCWWMVFWSSIHIKQNITFGCLPVSWGFPCRFPCEAILRPLRWAMASEWWSGWGVASTSVTAKTWIRGWVFAAWKSSLSSSISRLDICSCPFGSLTSNSDSKIPFCLLWVALPCLWRPARPLLIILWEIVTRWLLLLLLFWYFWFLFLFLNSVGS